MQTVKDTDQTAQMCSLIRAFSVCNVLPQSYLFSHLDLKMCQKIWNFATDFHSSLVENVSFLLNIII